MSTRTPRTAQRITARKAARSKGRAAALTGPRPARRAGRAAKVSPPPARAVPLSADMPSRVVVLHAEITLFAQVRQLPTQGGPAVPVRALMRLQVGPEATPETELPAVPTDRPWWVEMVVTDPEPAPGRAAPAFHRFAPQADSWVLLRQSLPMAEFTAWASLANTARTLSVAIDEKSGLASLSVMRSDFLG